MARSGKVGTGSFFTASIVMTSFLFPKICILLFFPTLAPLLSPIPILSLAYTVSGMWNNSTPVAVKILKEGTMKPEEFLKEAAIMKQLHHPKLVALYAVCSQEEPLHIITELMNGGSLLKYLQKDQGQTITWNNLIDIAAQVMSVFSICFMCEIVEGWP